MIVLGLTGSIGMGKTTTAAMFAARGVPVWDADKVVRDLYGPGGKAMLALAGEFPLAIVEGQVSKLILRQMIARDPTVLARLNGLVHPIVQSERRAYLASCKAKIVVLDIPLLFETGADKDCDKVIVVSAPAEVQKARVLSRGEMTEEQFNLILSQQMPDAEKRQRADYVIWTTSLAEAERQVDGILEDLGRV